MKWLYGPARNTSLEQSPSPGGLSGVKEKNSRLRDFQLPSRHFQFALKIIKTVPCIVSDNRGTGRLGPPRDRTETEEWTLCKFSCSTESQTGQIYRVGSIPTRRYNAWTGTHPT